MTLGKPNTDKTLSNIGITHFAEVELTISTTGYLESSSISTVRYSSVGNEPHKTSEMAPYGCAIIADGLAYTTLSCRSGLKPPFRTKQRFGARDSLVAFVCYFKNACLKCYRNNNTLYLEERYHHQLSAISQRMCHIERCVLFSLCHSLLR